MIFEIAMDGNILNVCSKSGVVKVDFGENPEICVNVWCSGVVPECVDRPKDPGNERIRIVAFKCWSEL